MLHHFYYKLYCDSLMCIQFRIYHAPLTHTHRQPLIYHSFLFRTNIYNLPHAGFDPQNAQLRWIYWMKNRLLYHTKPPRLDQTCPFIVFSSHGDFRVEVETKNCNCNIQRLSYQSEEKRLSHWHFDWEQFF